jgi:hypothetical protein
MSLASHRGIERCEPQYGLMFTAVDQEHLDPRVDAFYIVHNLAPVGSGHHRYMAPTATP